VVRHGAFSSPPPGGRPRRTPRHAHRPNRHILATATAQDEHLFRKKDLPSLNADTTGRSHPGRMTLTGPGQIPATPAAHLSPEFSRPNFRAQTIAEASFRRQSYRHD
jgi:hypothetical protein